MRIIAGELRGRGLVSPKGEECRPAMGRTREALFSMLEARGLEYPEARVLDIFAGSGSLSFEALSRGAKEALLIEKSSLVRQCIEKNCRALNVQEKIRIVQEDALRYLRRGSPEGFDLVFLDPPYRQNLVNPSLTLLVEKNWLREGAFLVAEVEEGASVSLPRELTFLTERLFGQTFVVMARYENKDE